MNKAFKYFLFVFFLIIIDQVIKLWMHNYILPKHFGQYDLVPGYFKLQYVLNRGMAFGIELGSQYGKIILTSFRLIAMVVIGVYLYRLANKKNVPEGLMWSISAILAGAIGNLIDSIFYGVYLDNAPADSASPWFHGQVIDMFYAEFLDGYWPNWVPFFGGTYNSTPIFNFADACIFCGVLAILLFQNRFFEQLNND